MDPGSEGLGRAVPQVPSYLVLVGGSFQGKSLMAVRLADILGMPHILSTDLVRNTLRVMSKEPPAWLGTTTYRLTVGDLRRQCAAVSELASQLLGVFAQRGESAVLEGMHFSKSFLNALGRRNDVLLVGVDNRAAYDLRIKMKVAVTRRRGNVADYAAFRDRIEDIHRCLLRQVVDARGLICSYDDLDEGVATIRSEARRHLRLVRLPRDNGPLT